ncbi:MAG: DNA replication/repair protein RecF [Eubacteriales bacterium]|nr:DNA replication/repair protein RecF [Eubacteriales bacterium]
MQIKTLKLVDFRNYETAEIVFERGTNILFGNNAQGKTNLLEALYLLSTTKSHRRSYDREMIRFGQKEAYIHGVFEDKYGDIRVDLCLQRGKSKRITVNGLPLKKTGDLIGMIHMVVFSPEDLNIIKSSPAMRRNFMDRELCQINKMYMQDLSVYKRVLEQRNKLLKDAARRKDVRDTLAIWDLQLVKYGQRIIGERKAFIHRIREVAAPMHQRLTGNKESLDIGYMADVEAASFEEELQKHRERDLRYQTTTVGPHRDDLSFFIDGKDVQTYGSQGQQRTVALILKLSEIEILRTIFKKEPILLLDDVLSELDRHRQKLLLNMVKTNQTFITCTGLEELIENQFEMNSVFSVNAGTVVRCNEEVL